MLKSIKQNQTTFLLIEAKFFFYIVLFIKIMTTKKEYKKMLDRAFEKIPEGFHGTERWEYPKVEMKYEGKNTIIKNFKKIVNQINREEKHFFKYILQEVGTAGEIKGSTAQLKGRQKQNTLNRLIKNYCDNYVICETCLKPDTVIRKEGRKHIMVCQACGTRHIVKW